MDDKAAIPSAERLAEIRPMFSSWAGCTCARIPHAVDCPRAQIPTEILEALDAGRALLAHIDATAARDTGAEVSAPDLGDLSLATLLERRVAAVESIAAIDAALAQRGVRAAAKTPARSRSAASTVLTVLSLRGEATTKEIRAVTPIASAHALDQLLYCLTKAGEIERVARGRYRLVATQKNSGGDE